MFVKSEKRGQCLDSAFISPILPVSVLKSLKISKTKQIYTEMTQNGQLKLAIFVSFFKVQSELLKRNVRQVLLFTDPWGQGGAMSFIGLDGKPRDPIKQVR